MKLYNKISYEKGDVKYKEYFLFDKIQVLKKENSFNYRKTFLLSRCVSHKRNFNFLCKNPFDLSKIFTPVNNNIDKSEKIDIIIPVYNGYDYLFSLFDSVKNNTDLDYRLIVIEDKSTDERILPFLERVKEKFGDRMLLLKNEQNLGFVKTVNKALDLANENFVLLNTDVVLPKNWASRLFQPIFSDEKIATVTPLSNAATIFSLPVSGKDCDFNADIDVINDELFKINILENDINAPTGMGFCMAISKIAAKDVGCLDEIFDKGYGEENDWCQRAIAKGYKNKIAFNLFVWHKHGGSFNAEEKALLLEKNSKILKKKHPKYYDDLNDMLCSVDFKTMHFLSQILYLKAICNCVQVWFDHTWGGGTETYTFDKISILKNDNLIIRIQNEEKSDYVVSFYYKNYSNKIILEALNDLTELIKILDVELIVVNNLASYENILETLSYIEYLKTLIGVKVSFRGHDLQCICPTVQMLNYQNEYCNCKNFENCSVCYEKFLEEKKIIKIDSVELWQQKWGHFLQNVVDEIIVFSESTKNIYTKFYLNIEDKIKIIPHSLIPIRKVEIKKHSDINIGVIGNINISKGALLLKEVDKILPKYKNINVKIIGNSEIKNFKNIQNLGFYDIKNLPDIIEKNNIDIIFIPSICPETYSYTTTEAMGMGLFVASFDIGAPPERLRNYHKGIVISKIDAQSALDEIIDFYTEYNSISSSELTV